MSFEESTELRRGERRMVGAPSKAGEAQGYLCTTWKTQKIREGNLGVSPGDGLPCGLTWRCRASVLVLCPPGGWAV